MVYSFKVEEGRSAVFTVQGSATLPAPGWVVLDACDPVHANIVGSGSNNGGTATGMAVRLEPGIRYYWVITTDPGAGQPNSTCGSFTATASVPVGLQSFVVE